MNNFLTKNIPGVTVCLIAGTLVYFTSALGKNILLDPLILALIVGVLFRNFLGGSNWHREGSNFISKYLLEISILLLGGSISMTYLVTGGISLAILIILGPIK